MSSTQYTKGIYKLARNEVNLLTDDLRLVMVDTAGYTADLDADEFLSAVPLADRVATSPALSSKSITIDTAPSPDEVMFDCADPTFTGVTGDPTEAVVLIAWTGDAATSPLLGYYDGATVQLTPNSNDVIAQISASGLMRWKRA